MSSMSLWYNYKDAKLKDKTNTTMSTNYTICWVMSMIYTTNFTTFYKYVTNEKKRGEIVAWRDWQGAAFVSPIP